MLKGVTPISGDIQVTVGLNFNGYNVNFKRITSNGWVEF